MTDNAALPHLLTHSLQSRTPKTATEWRAKAAAVLVPLYFDSGQWQLLLTRRTDDLDSHRGQVSFPGGAIEPNDENAEAAALREAHEEIGLPAERVGLLGRLDPLLTISQFHVTPVVGTVDWPFELRINPTEVARAFSVPLAWLLEPGHLELRHRGGSMIGAPVPIYYFEPFDGEVIWGVTARIIVGMLDILRPLLA